MLAKKRGADMAPIDFIGEIKDDYGGTAGGQRQVNALHVARADPAEMLGRQLHERTRIANGPRHVAPGVAVQR